MKVKLGKKFWFTLSIFGLMGQVAWVVENMYFNVFIYKMFNASAAQISMMVSASAIAATLTTWLMGALSDRIGKRKALICVGYIMWGISILGFAFLKPEYLETLTGSAVAAASLGVTLVIVLDCLMTFFGSTANDACFNAWMTDMGDDSNRGAIEGINAMMPLVAILVVFGGFMAFDLDKSSSWTMIFYIIGFAVIFIGIMGFFMIDEPKNLKKASSGSYISTILYCFRGKVFKANKLLYVVTGAFAVFGISIQIFMPYLILYYEQSLGMTNYVLVMAPAIIIAAIVTAFYGKLYDKLGFKSSVVPTLLLLMSGYVILYFGRSTAVVFIGSLLMMIGYLTGMAIFGAMIRDNIPESKSGQFQGLRIFGQVFVSGIIGPAIGAWVLKDAKTIVNSDGTTSFIPNENIFFAALVVALLVLVCLFAIFKMVRNGHRKLETDMDAYYESEAAYATENNTSKVAKLDTYPRPQLRRDSFYILDGEWMLNDRPINVPYSPQAELSGYGHRVGKKLHYVKIFTLPTGFVRDKVILHFGAVDQIAKVVINGQTVGTHEGGYLSFEVDITEAVNKDKENILEVEVLDTLSKDYPYGKQCKKRGGMWYTPVSGIWQSVWLESVPKNYIKGLKITPKVTWAAAATEVTGTDTKATTATEVSATKIAIKSAAVTIKVDLDKPTSYKIRIALEDGEFVSEYTEEEVTIPIENPHLWSVDDPYLYEFRIEMGEDIVTSYFALRTIEVVKGNGNDKICLNGKPCFLHAVLDQGYYSDGIYLPKDLKGYAADILAMKNLGFNALRKHIKVEPEYFYYACDKLGMFVMQDMVNNGSYQFMRDTALPTLGRQVKKDNAPFVSKKRKDIFIQHTIDTINQLYNHPCIVYYTIFNEGWGQFEADRLYDIVKEADSTRIIDSTSGWFRRDKSDVESLHIYFKAVEPEAADKPVVISECGGYSYTLPENSFSLYNQYGYGSCVDSKDLTDRVVDMYEKMVIPAVEKGVLWGSVYTQLSDVEDESNGFYTYDRKILKVDRTRMREVADRIKESMFS
ncbi:MAG: MFS transporter [Lachnospiraceae bacterium]|nr:MFS transporter [Lachnospiraceae bacterium]